jgi:chemotaxis protein methyltransferase CheR
VRTGAKVLGDLRPSGSRSKREASALDAGIIPIRPEVFSKFQRLIYDQAGIWLGTHKTALLTGRLARRLRLLGLESMLDYYQLVTQPDQQHERAMMIDCVTTNETHFFREPRHFDFLISRVFPLWKQQELAGKRTKYIRVWSAGCSSGEESYTLAMVLAKHFPPELGWNLELLGTDISTRVLEAARQAIFPISRCKEIPQEYLKSAMLKGIADQGGKIKVRQEIRKLVRFARVNLHADSYPLSGAFDLIFCRNVLIYFDPDSKKKVINGLIRHLSPEGLLFVGHSENLHGITSSLTPVVSTVYSLAGGAGTTA